MIQTEFDRGWMIATSLIISRLETAGLDKAALVVRKFREDSL